MDHDMLLEDIYKGIPMDWHPMDQHNERFKVIPLDPLSLEYHDIEFKILGNYYSCITGIYKVQNPFLYAKFALKSYDYDKRGPFDVLSLFHDTPRENVASIVGFNFDWRYGGRYKYGPGVYFSVSPYLANKHSNRSSSLYRSMFIADVLVQNIQEVHHRIFLPDFGYDTVLAHNNCTYVKYFDGEFYPRYFVDYISLW
ncbi:hypothetical protein NQ315_011499 [Exocentrus adspersus]|uniref:Poly [ADP-ribose] polymerase n=1 Tax=Exocentrus adspersus TaxID=1586481 RepID=A0AAV8VUK7_9CUCU|nr:hypothetical protein NQ315_011499 [Exocentrus adspersus]